MILKKVDLSEFIKNWSIAIELFKPSVVKEQKLKPFING